MFIGLLDNSGVSMKKHIFDVKKLVLKKQNIFWKFNHDKRDPLYNGRYINFVFDKNEFKGSGKITLKPVLSLKYLEQLSSYYDKCIKDDMIKANDFFCYFWPTDIKVYNVLEELKQIYKNPDMVIINGDGNKLEGYIYKKIIDCKPTIIILNDPNFDPNFRRRVWLNERQLTDLAQVRYGSFLKFADKSDFVDIIIELFGKKLGGADINIPAMVHEHINNTEIVIPKIDIKFDNLNMVYDNVACTVNSIHMQDSYKVVLARSIHEKFSSSYEITHWGVSRK